jgi:predicted CXXCH cytochrome family protein
VVHSSTSIFELPKTKKEREQTKKGRFLEMSKLKISLAAIFMLIMLGMFGGLVSAAGTEGPVTGKSFDPTNLQNPAPTLNNATIDNSGATNSHKTHGNFQNNTNACSNCHSTHNGQDEMLLMKSSASDLCMTCHDGTLGFYNVYKPSEAGVMFSQDDSASMHPVTSGLTESAAPGASTTAITTNSGSLTNTSSATFECSSCHNPHGSANDRLLSEKVAGNTYGKTYNVNIVGYTETITKTGDIPLGQKAIKLDLVEDPAYADINSATGLSGLKIYKSNGIYPESKQDASNPLITLAKIRDYKLNYSNFCASCHNDYLKSREDGARTQTLADGTHLYTHSTNSTKTGRGCVSCHYAHGTDISILKDTAGKNIAQVAAQPGWNTDLAKAYMKDVSKGGSNLKRFTNMAVCWACHQSTHQIANTPGTSNYPDASTWSNFKVPGGDYSGKALIK